MDTPKLDPSAQEKFLDLLFSTAQTAVRVADGQSLAVVAHYRQQWERDKAQLAAARRRSTRRKAAR